MGWNWVTEAHRLGHEVWALASPAHREAILAECSLHTDLSSIHWIFPEVRFWKLAPGQDAVRERTHNLLWQMAALRAARKLSRTVCFDAVHHMTWAGIRAPTFLGSLGLPLIIGPIGGGETSPPGLRNDLRAKARLTEAIRDLSNATITLNPAVRGGLKQAAAIFVKTPETRDLLSPAMQAKSVLFPELTINQKQIGEGRGERVATPRLLFVGRLIYWKGAHIALAAFARLRKQTPAARLTVVGRGPEKQRLKLLAAALDLGGSIEFLDLLPQQSLFDLYDSHDLCVFPSLHDSGGTVVLEALCRGLPVICLDLGGPRQIVTERSGIVVSSRLHTTSQVVRAMADSMQELFSEPGRLRALSDGAIARAYDFLCTDQVRKFYNAVAAIADQAAQPVETRRHKSRKEMPDGSKRS